MRSGSAFRISGIPVLSRDRIPNFPGVDSHIFHTLCHAAPDLAVFLDFRKLGRHSCSSLFVSGLVRSPTIFICVCMLSAARQIAAVVLSLSSRVCRKLSDLLAFRRGLSCQSYSCLQAYEVWSCTGHSFLLLLVFDD